MRASRSAALRRVLRFAVVAGAACAINAGTLYAQNKGPLRFGNGMPLTGSQALFGADQAKAQQWAVDDINAKGGINGRKLEMILLDTQGEPQLGINAVNRLVGFEKVPLTLISWSSVVKATAAIVNREKVLAINTGGNSPEIAHLGEFVYTSFPLADVDIAALARYTYSTLNHRRAAVLYINNESGTAGAKVYKEVFEKVGGKVVAYEGYDPKAMDYAGMLLRVRNSGAEIVHIQGLVSDLPQVLAQMRQLGLKQRASSYSAGYNPKIIEQLGQAAEGLIVTSLAPSAQDNPRVGEFIERWKQKEGRIPNGLPYTQYTYDSVYVVAKLFEWVEQKKLPHTGENFRRALLEIKEFDLPLTGKMVVDGHRISKPVYLWTVQNGKFVQMAKID
jgi:branched-chain amino acid transport system substrate-binding protein